jgi:hypothetical protein
MVSRPPRNSDTSAINLDAIWLNGWFNDKCLVEKRLLFQNHTMSRFSQRCEPKSQMWFVRGTGRYELIICHLLVILRICDTI